MSTSEQTLLEMVVQTLEDTKAIDLKTFDVATLTPMTDYMLFCTGTSSRHVKTLSEHLVEASKHLGAIRPRVESDPDYQWVLIDMGGVIAHVMQADAREFYQLEKLWNAKSICTSDF